MILKHGFVLAPDGDVVGANGDGVSLRPDFLAAGMKITGTKKKQKKTPTYIQLEDTYYYDSFSKKN